VLSVAVQTGLSALKTPQCYSANSKNPNCPVCQPNLNEMAEPLPFSHCAQSRLMCRVTKKPLNEYNLPMMLPNGQIFGQQVILFSQVLNAFLLILNLLQALPEITKDGIILCPITGEKFPDAKLEKVFIM
jgi:macrophage erythroblast attacher